MPNWKKVFKHSREEKYPFQQSQDVSPQRELIAWISQMMNSVTEDEKLFEGGCALKWIIASAEIRHRFLRNWLEKYITGAKISHDDGTVTWQEVTFDEPEPSERDRVDIPYQERIARQKELFDRREARANDREYTDDGERVDALREIAHDRNKAEVSLVTFRLDLREWFESAHEHWRCRRDDFLRDQRMVRGLFQSSIDQHTLGLVQNELNANAFTAAWNRLNEHFLELAKGSDQLVLLLSTLHTLIYSPDMRMQEHIVHIDILCEAVKPLDGHGYSDAMKTAILIESIKRSSAFFVYKATLIAIRLENTPVSWERVCDLLCSTYAYDSERLRVVLVSGGRQNGGCSTCGKMHRGACWRQSG